MNKKGFLSLLFITLWGTISSFAQNDLPPTPSERGVERGAQITSESNLVSGKPYLLYYVGNNGCYVKAMEGNDYFKALAADLVLTDEAVFYFLPDGDKWKIQSRKTNRFFPVPTKSTTFAPTEAEAAGAWSLNFQENNNIAPSCVNGATTYSLNRSRLGNGTSVLHGWTQGTAQANQLRIYEIALSTTSIVETGQVVSVTGTGESDLETNQWYVMRKNGIFFIDDAANGYTTSTAPKGFGRSNSRYLVRLESDGNGKYYVQTGYGNYLFTGNTTTRVSATAYTAEELKGLWELHKLVDPIRPTASEVYTLNGSGAWIFVPNGFTNQYYLFNVASGNNQYKFSYPSASGEWTFSQEAVPVLLETLGDSHYCITTKDGAKTFVVGDEGHMTVAKSRDASSAETTALNTALGNLLSNGVSKLTLPTDITQGAAALDADFTKGWFALRIKNETNHPEYDGNFLYTLPTENWAYSRPHPMSHGGDFMKHPLKDDAQYYVRLWPVTRTENEGGNEVTKTFYHWQVPNGKYVVNHNNDYPITWIRDASDFILGQNADGTFYIQSSGYRTQICTDGNGNDYLGKTKSRYVTSPTRLDIYPVDVAAAGLRPWKVVFNTGADDVKLHYQGAAAVKGLRDVYNNGFFFFPEGVEPGASDFQINGEDVTAEIHNNSGSYSDPYTIHVTYAPAVCIESSGITVVQGSRTAGVKNTMQAVLRIEVNPVAPCYPTAFNINLTGASSLSNVSAYLTNADQLQADGVARVPLASQGNPTEGTLKLSVSKDTYKNADHLLTTGEHNYIWITADIKDDANVESNEVDASISSIEYVNVLTNYDHAATCSVSYGNPDGTMRIFYRQNYLWVSTDQNSDAARFYRNPVILPLDGENVLAFSEYRYDDVSELGKDYDNSDYGHRIDIVMRKSTDNGKNWTTAETIAFGTDATESTKASGFSNPAVVRTKSGKIICLMAMGQEAFDSNVGLRHIGMISSTNSGASWTAPVDIYDDIEWGEHSPSSAYITAGKGVCFNNGRIAFVLNERASSNSDEYVLYSDDEGDSWKFVPTSLFMNGKWGKLVVMNDDRLMASVSRGNDTEYLGRGYNSTTGSAAATGIETWNTSSNWEGKLNSYGRNNDILYFQRGTNGVTTTDVMLHTVYNKVDSKDALRLYASFDQSATWKEFFTILPANASVSSMQTLNDGNLAIFFEDGSIGGGANGSYALNYVVIRKEIFDEQVSDVLSSIIIEEGETDSNAPYVTWKTDGWTQSFTTQDKTGFAGVVVSSSFDGAFNRESGAGSKRYICLKASEAGATDEITISAPAGYLIKSYTITAKKKSTETYTLSANEVSPVALSDNTSEEFSVSNIYQPSATFSFGSTSGSGSYALISNFVVELTKGYYVVSLNQVNPNTPGDRSYATLYSDYDLRQTDNQTKAYYVSSITDGRVILEETPNDGRDIPRLTPVVLINSEGTKQTAFTVVEELSSLGQTNLLSGTLTPKELDMGTNANLYSFGRRRTRANEQSNWGDYVAGFYNTGSKITLGANKAYLDTSAQSSRGFDLSLPDDNPLTDILSLPTDQPAPVHNPAWYTLDGRQLALPPTNKGIYIHNGKKIIIH